MYLQYMIFNIFTTESKMINLELNTTNENWSVELAALNDGETALINDYITVLFEDEIYSVFFPDVRLTSTEIKPIVTHINLVANMINDLKL